MDAFDADVLIYAAAPEHPLGSRVLHLLENADVAIGSTLLLPELLTKPLRGGVEAEASRLIGLLARIDLVDCDTAVATLAVALGARHGLHAADAVHLATAVHAGASRFITNNRKDFTDSIDEIDIVYPDALPRGAGADTPP